jgi:cobalt-zinc-cadmium resistance protein CzcA
LKIIALALKQTYCLTSHFRNLFLWCLFNFQISIGAVPDVTHNQVQVITTSQNLSTQDIEQYITYPVEIEMAKSELKKFVLFQNLVYLSLPLFEDEGPIYLDN